MPGRRTRPESSPPKLSQRLDRARLCAWLRDKARAEEETAAHARRRWGRTKPGHPNPAPAGILDGDYPPGPATGSSWSNVDRARAFRDVAAALERGEPDAFGPKDDTPREPSRSGEHAIDRHRKE